MIEPIELLDGRVRLYHGSCLDVLKELPANSIESCVVDPPYELGFMGKSWDSTGIAFSVETWKLVLRVLKPGAYVAAFCAPRNVHRLAIAIEDAGFEIRDRILNYLAADTIVQRFLETLNDEQIDAFIRCFEDSRFGGELAWAFGTGFPKNLNISKAIDKAKGLAAQRGYIPTTGGLHGGSGNTVGKFKSDGMQLSDNPVSPEAKQWNGWGTALKPAYEPIVLARKPLEGTVIANVMKHGVGGLNIAATKIAVAEGELESRDVAAGKGSDLTIFGDGLRKEWHYDGSGGRWPADIVHDGSPDVIGAFPTGADENVSVARFFFTAKEDDNGRLGSKHPTVKPVDLMRWLCRMVTPPGGTVLDIFSGSGSTGEGAFLEGFKAILIEREAEYITDIKRRLESILTAGPMSRKQMGKANKQKPAEELPLFSIP